MTTIQIPGPQRLRREGDVYVVVIPADVVERYGLRPDDLVQVELQTVDAINRVSSDLRESLAYALEDSDKALRYLRDH